MKAAVIAFGSIEDNKRVEAECKNADYIICADGGAGYAYNANIMPDFLIGDFDSLNAQILEYFKSKKVKIIKYPKEKDYTDTELCVKKALELNCRSISILAGIGDRIDHSLGNIGLLHMVYKEGSMGYIISDKSDIYLCTDKIQLKGKAGDTVSLIPYNGDAAGVTTKGLKYPLNDAVVYFGSPIGISNIMTDDVCMVGIKSGEILVIKQNKL